MKGGIRPLENFQDREFDLIVIGAGINGAGIARDAAMRGLSVLLLDKGDISSGTTSWSTRLIHGGLRYLEYYASKTRPPGAAIDDGSQSPAGRGR